MTHVTSVLELTDLIALSLTLSFIIELKSVGAESDRITRLKKCNSNL